MVPAERSQTQDELEFFEKLEQVLCAQDPKDQAIIRVSLELLAVARRALSVHELAWAFALATIEDDVSTVAELQRLVDVEKILHLIRPYVGDIDLGAPEKRQMRFVNRSVKEFVILGFRPSVPRSYDVAMMPEADRSFSDQRISELEALILEICVRYLSLEEIGTACLFDNHQLAAQEMTQDVDILDNEGVIADYDSRGSWEEYELEMSHFNPADRGLGEFFVYASSEWVMHLGAVAQTSSSTLGGIEKICSKQSQRLYNWTQQNCRPNCAMLPRFDFDHRRYDPLAMICLYGSDNLLNWFLEHADFERPCYFDHTVMVATNLILLYGDVARLVTLFRKGRFHEKLLHSAFFEAVLRHWPGRRRHESDWIQVFDLVREVPLDFTRQHGETMVATAEKLGCDILVRRIRDKLQSDGEQSAHGAQEVS